MGNTPVDSFKSPLLFQPVTLKNISKGFMRRPCRRSGVQVVFPFVSVLINCFCGFFVSTSWRTHIDTHTHTHRLHIVVLDQTRPPALPRRRTDSSGCLQVDSQSSRSDTAFSWETNILCFGLSCGLKASVRYRRAPLLIRLTAPYLAQLLPVYCRRADGPSVAPVFRPWGAKTRPSRVEGEEKKNCFHPCKLVLLGRSANNSSNCLCLKISIAPTEAEKPAGLEEKRA